MVIQTHHITRLLTLVIAVALVLAGCDQKKEEAPAEQQAKNTNQESPKPQVPDIPQPPKQQVADKVRLSLPVFLSLDSIELEAIPAGSDAVKDNFKAIVVPKEDLCVVDRVSKMQDVPDVTLLKVVQAAGTKASLYGSVVAHRGTDAWTLESPEIQTGLKHFGEPLGAFPPQSYITGSDEANNALKQQAANAELAEKEKQAAREKQEKEIKALVEGAVRGNLPLFLSLESIEAQNIPLGADPIKIYFNAIVVLKEDLCQLDHVSKLPDVQDVTLLKVVQAAGTKALLEGSVTVSRIQNSWSPPEFQGLDQFGKPKRTFPPQSYIIDGVEANTALNEQADAAKAIKDKKEAEHQEVHNATAAGKCYTGTIVYEGALGHQQRNIRLVFGEQPGDNVLADASDPGHDRKRRFGGKIVFDPKPDKDGEIYSIELGPDGSGSKGKDDSGFMAWDPFYWSGDGSFKLRLTDEGVLKGKASMWKGGLQGDYTISLEPDKTP